MLNLNVWNLLFTVINVLVLYFVLKKFLFKPVLSILEKRQDIITANIAEARKSQLEAEVLKCDYQEKISFAKEEAQSIVHNAREMADQERDGILAKAKEESDQMIERAKAAILSEQEQAQQDAKEEIAKLAVLAARKIIEAGDAHDADSY